MQTAEQPKSLARDALISQSDPQASCSAITGEHICEAVMKPEKKAWTNHLKELTNILVASLPLLGALGTGFVWLVMTFYVGTVDIKPNTAFKSIDVYTYDCKGTEFHFRSPHFQLMPGDYAFLVSCDQAPGRVYNAHVNFKETTSVAVAVNDDTKSLEELKPKEESPKKWWQFWRIKR